MRRGFAALLLAIGVLAGCGGGGSDLAPAAEVAGFAFSTESDVIAGQAIDARYTCDGNDVSPALSWEGAPEGTRELALVLEDPDAPGGTYTHWLVYALSSRVTSVPENVPGDEQVESPTPLRQGENDFGETRYDGPCPPEGETHRYVFRLLALDSELGLEGGADRGGVDAAVGGHVLAEARLEATYGR
jgi:Raf kinase inhibitor-like YbhB/YbcL family protein